MGDYNDDAKETNMKVFCSQHKLKAFNEEPTCFKSFNIYHALTSSLQIAQRVSKNAQL